MGGHQMDANNISMRQEMCPSCRLTQTGIAIGEARGFSVRKYHYKA